MLWWRKWKPTPVFLPGESHGQGSQSCYSPWGLKESDMTKYLSTLAHIEGQCVRTHTPPKCPLHYRGLECKSRKSRNTWSNRQIWPWSTEWSRVKASGVLPRECTGHSKRPLPTTQEKILHMDIPHGQYRNQTDYILCSQRWRSSIQSAKIRPGTDCGSDTYCQIQT